MGIIDWIFPRECLKCGKIGAYLCFECKKSLSPHPELCPGCHKAQKGARLCSGCRSEGKMALEGIIVGFAYEKWLKRLILKLKFYHKSDVGSFLAERAELLVLTHEELAVALTEQKLIVSWVPSHRWRKYFEKGYNQSEILAQQLAQRLQVPCRELARKSKKTPSQLTLTRQARLENLKGAFQTRDLRDIEEGSQILLIDDVTTTGATLNQLALVIKKVRPGLKIWGLVIARHMG